MLNYTYIFFISFALGLDAFAVSMAGGAYFGRATGRQQFRLAFHFGLFQLLMPIIGWLLGITIVNFVKDFDHWIAFIILFVIGAKMIIEAMKGESERISKDISKGWTMVGLAIATSIDALAVGFSMGVMNSIIFLPSIIIGIVAAAMSLIGIKLGEYLSDHFGRKVEIAGGIVLILIGLNILREHLF